MDGPGCFLLEVLRGVERPIGVAEKFAGKKDEVSLAGADDLVGLRGCGDHAYGSGGDGGFVVDGLGVDDLIAGTERDLLGGMVAASGDVDEIHA